MRTHSSLLLFSKSLRKRSRSETIWKKQWMFGFIFGTGSFNPLIHWKELTGSPSWEVPGGGWGAGWGGSGGPGAWAGAVFAALGRCFCHFAVTLFPSLWDSWPAFTAAPPCLCWQVLAKTKQTKQTKPKRDCCTLHLGTLQRQFRYSFSE